MFWKKLFFIAIRHIKWHKIINRGGNIEMSYDEGDSEIKVIITSGEVIYTREEIVKMLEIIKHHEKIMQWKVL